MPKNITLSLRFLDKHPRKGQQTFFPEKFLANIGVDYTSAEYWKTLLEINKDKLESEDCKLTKDGLFAFWRSLIDIDTVASLSGGISSKGHTIRQGNRFKTGDKANICVWINRPYHDPQIRLWHPVEINVNRFKIGIDHDYKWIDIKESIFYEENLSFKSQLGALTILANSDGLALEDFKAWFKWPSDFAGQILIWDKEIEY